MLCNYTWGGRKAIKGWVKDFFPFAVEMNAKKIVIKTMLMYCERKLEVSEAENSSRLILKLFLTHIFWFFSGLTRPALYPFPATQYPYPMLSPEMTAASWHTPSMYSAASSFRSPYPSSLPINSISR